VAGIGTSVPPSPTPLAPSGLVVLGAENDTDRRQHIGAQDAVIHQRAGQQLAAVGVVDDVLGERLLLALRDAARDLPLRQ